MANLQIYYYEKHTQKNQQQRTIRIHKRPHLSSLKLWQRLVGGLLSTLVTLNGAVSFLKKYKKNNLLSASAGAQFNH